jgi:hypothetical protein
MRIREWIIVVIIVAFALILMVSVAATDGPWDKTTVASLELAVATFLAVGAALWIGIRDRWDALRIAAAVRDSSIRRREYEECVRLLELVERDRRAWQERRDTLPRSVEATALIRAMSERRNWWSATVDWYIDSREPGWRFSDLKPNDPRIADVFATIEREIVEAIMTLDFEDRRPMTAEQPNPV